MRVLNWSFTRLLIIGTLEKTAMKEKESFFGKLLAWWKQRVDGGAKGQVKGAKTVVTARTQQAEAATSKVGGVEQDSAEKK